MPLPEASHANRRLPSWVRLVTPSLVALALFAMAVLPQGSNPGAGESTFNAETGEWEFRHDFSVVDTAAISAGILSAMLLVLSPFLAFRRVLRLVPARWHLALHRRVGVAILSLALLHGLILPFVGFYRGWLSGVIALALLALHGASGAWKRPLVASWGPDAWRYLHLTTAWSALLFTAFHSFLSGIIEHHGG